jgi:hypothetical protein
MSPATTPTLSRDWAFSSLPRPGRAEHEERRGLREWLRLRRHFRPERLARCTCFWNDEDVVSRSSWKV